MLSVKSGYEAAKILRSPSTQCAPQLGQPKQQNDVVVKPVERSPAVDLVLGVSGTRERSISIVQSLV